MSSAALPTRGAQCSRRSRAENPRGNRRKTDNALKSACPARSAKRNPTGPLSLDLNRSIDLAERVFADGAVLADPLDVQETSVGLKADPPQGGQVGQPFADAEVARVVDRRLGPQGAAFLVILLDPRVLVVDVQRRRHPLGEHAGPEPARRPPGDPSVED